MLQQHIVRIDEKDPVGACVAGLQGTLITRMRSARPARVIDADRDYFIERTRGMLLRTPDRCQAFLV